MKITGAPCYESYPCLDYMSYGVLWQQGWKSEGGQAEGGL
jgi:hypothetical protein